MKKVKVAFIGVGKMGSLHLDKYYNNRNVEIVGFHDNDPEVAIKISEVFETPFYANPIKLIEAADAVVICTPASEHYQYIMVSLNRNKHIFTEKPVVSKKEAWLDIHTEYLKKENLVFNVGMIERYNPIITDVRLDISKLNINVLDGIKGFAGMFYRAGVIGNTRNRDVSCIWDLMVHDVDIYCHLFPDMCELTKITCTKKLVDEKGYTYFASFVCLFNDKYAVSFECNKDYKRARRKVYFMYDDPKNEKNYQRFEIDLVKETAEVSTEQFEAEIAPVKNDKLMLECATFVDACLNATENNGLSVTVNDLSTVTKTMKIMFVMDRLLSEKAPDPVLTVIK